MRNVKSYLAATALMGILATGAVADDIAVVGGTAFTMKGGEKIENATVLIHDGKITAVGAGIAVPDGYSIIDAKGKWVTPGLMVAGTRMGLVEVSSWAGVDDSNASKYKTPLALDVAWGINPDNTIIPITRVEGVTRVTVGFGNTKGLFGGLGAVIHLGDDTDLVVRSKAFTTVAVGDAGAREVGSRSAVWQTLYAKFDGAKAHMEKAAEKAKKKEGDKKPKADKPNPERDALVSILKGEMTLIMGADKASDLRHIMTFKAKYPAMKIAVGGAQEGWRVADALAAAKIPVIIGGMSALPGSFETLGATMHNAARLSKAGVKVAFVGDQTHNARLAPQHAGNAVAHGMSWDAAMAALTTVPASIFGMSDSYGTLVSGMDADVVVWDGDPLELMASPSAVIIQGQSQSLESRQTKLRDRYMEIPRSPAYKK